MAANDLQASDTAPRSLEDKIRAVGDPIAMLRNSQAGPYVFPVDAQYTNWRDEQEAWRKTAVLLNQSYHMTDLYVEGPDCLRLLSRLGVNSFAQFGPMKAKQFVACTEEGYVVGDAVLFGLGENQVNVVGRPPTCNWIEYHARTGGYDVRIRRDERSVQNPRERETYRFQVQGPAAGHILEAVNGGPLPEIRFFHMGRFKVGPYEVTALNHQMSGFPGLEFWGPAAEGEAVKAILMEAGRPFGLRLGGSRAYSTVAIESGWIPSPVPAIYTGEGNRAYREWLPAGGFEANASLGGSFASARMEDYYQTPWDLGYGFMVKFDHDFVGRAALERMAAAGPGRPHRRKTWLMWDRRDVGRVFDSLYEADDARFKYMDMPAAHYATFPLDTILRNGRMIGLSTYPVYSSNLRSWISLCMIDEDQVAYGEEVTVVWGEEGGGSAKPIVERHVQTGIRAMMAPKPFGQAKA